MTEEECREMARNNYAAQMEMLGYQTDGSPKDMVEVVRCKDCAEYQEWDGGKICMRLGSYYGDVPPDWFCADGKAKVRQE